MDFDSENALPSKAQHFSVLKCTTRNKRHRKGSDGFKKNKFRDIKSIIKMRLDECIGDTSRRIKKPDKLIGGDLGLAYDGVYLPSAPHNTTQYLTANHCRGRQDHPINYGYPLMRNEDLRLLLSEGVFTIEDICITGGTMKGVLSELRDDEYEDLGCKSDACFRRINDLVDVISLQRNMIENLKQQVQDVQKRIL
jgi:hypothetical protein